MGPSLLTLKVLNLGSMNESYSLKCLSTHFHPSKAIWVHLIMIGPQNGQNRPENDLIGPLEPIVGA